MAFALFWLACGLLVWGLVLDEARRAGKRVGVGWWLLLLVLGPLTPLLLLIAWGLDGSFDS